MRARVLLEGAPDGVRAGEGHDLLRHYGSTMYNDV